ncbi:MAG TPA: fatty acyl-AMP ligase [Acidimicrobiales bacterium]
MTGRDGTEANSWSGRRDAIDHLLERAECTPDQVLFVELMDGVNESARLTAAQLRDRAAEVASALGKAGIKQGDVAILIAGPPTDFLIGLMGCLWAGVIAAPVAFPRRAEHLTTRLEPVRANAGAVAVVAGTPQGDAERSVLELLTEGELPVISTSSTAITTAPPVGDRDVAYLQYTSGSTSDPKGVIVTHENLIANLGAITQLLDVRHDSVIVSWCPLTHDMGLVMGALPSLFFGCPAVLMPPGAFIRRPMSWMRALSAWGGTHGYSPNFGYDLCVDRSTPEERAELDLSSVRCLINGAEPVRHPTRDRFVEAFAPAGLRPEAHTAAYGLAEATVLVSASPLDGSDMVFWVDGTALERDRVVDADAGAAGARPLVGDGIPASQYDLRIVDPETRSVLPDDRVGELWARGPSVSPGYWLRPESTLDTFGTEIVGDEGGPYMRTGDLAFVRDGQIVICGRAKDLIVIHGRNIHPHDVELTAEMAHEAVRRGGAAAFSVEENGVEALVIVVEVDGDPDNAEITSAVRTVLLREFEVHVADVLLVGPQGIPKTSSGKKQRSMTRTLWQEARKAAPATR